MNTPRTALELLALYERMGAQHYGESITQTEHALQCAALARRDQASDAMVVAALFHDVGHLVVDTQGKAHVNLEEDDDDHEAVGARVLAPIFGPAVARPVALHVTAKRWRCTVDPTYHAALSPTSQATLKAQGGLLSPEECARFEAHPGFEDAITLRTWDDVGKVPGLDVGVLRDYETMITTLAVAR